MCSEIKRKNKNGYYDNVRDDFTHLRKPRDVGKHALKGGGFRHVQNAAGTQLHVLLCEHRGLVKALEAHKFSKVSVPVHALGKLAM